MADTGKGINKDIMAKLFEPQRDFIMRGTNLEKGVGLGLLLCNEFTAIMGSRMTVESEAGVGSTFSFSVPIVNKAYNLF